MSNLTRAELERQLSQGRLAPVYLLFGAEDYLRDAAARRISDAALRDASLRDFNETSFSLASADVQHAIAAAEQLPMMAARRVVRVTDFSRLREEDEAALARYLARPAETSVVLFVADDLDKRRKFSKTLLESCASVEFPAMSDADATAWARERLKKLKADADERTLRHLVALVGTGARRLSNEIDKLASAALPAGHVTMELVDSLVRRSREHSNFELTDHLVARDRRRSIETLRRLLDDGVEPVMLIGLLSSSYHKLALAKALMSQGAPNNEVNRLAPYQFDLREKFLAQARRTDAREIARSIARIAAADVAIKTSLGGGGKGSRLQLEMLVCELTG
ncbi:MAG TPA: DNA polymerase III subunit delta [Pyrinomonadaceae bacterium]|jgi:DNA polymerase-3 subunit delta|nr:DNA polymerase III subunit delta [Pyrinomonadaceae bacterium]